MTREETVNLVYAVLVTFPSQYKNIDKATIEKMVSAWFLILGDYDYKVVQSGFKAYCQSDRTGFAPSPGQIINAAQDIATPVASSGAEMWSLVLRASRDSIYHAEERFAELPPLVQQAVGSPSTLRAMGQVDTGTVDTVLQSQFLREYRALEEMSRKEGRYSPDLKALADAHRSEFRRAVLSAKDRPMLEDNGYDE